MAYFPKLNSLLSTRQSDILDPNLAKPEGQQGQQQEQQGQNGAIKTSAESLTTDSGGAPQQINQVKQSTFANPTAIIDANKGQASLDITSGSNKSIADAQAKLKTDADGFKEVAKATKAVPGLTDAQIEDGLAGKSNVDITGALNKKVIPLAPFDPINTAIGDAEYLSSQEGRDGLMRKAGGAGYNQGMLGLDSALTGFDPNYLTNIQKTQEKNGALNKGIVDEKANYTRANDEMDQDVKGKVKGLRDKLGEKLDGSGKSSESAKLQTKLENDQRQYLRDMLTKPVRGTAEYDEATQMAQAYADVAKEGLVKADPSLAEYATAGVVDPRKFMTVNADVSEDDYRTEGEATRFNKIAGLLDKNDKKSAGKAISKPVTFDAVAYGNEVQRMKRVLNPTMPAGDAYVQDPNGNWVKK